MPTPVKLQDSFSAAMKRDLSRTDLPANALWNIVDLFPDVLGAPLRKRGGYEYASQDLASVAATASYVAAGLVAPFTSGVTNIAFDEDGRAYRIISTGSTTDIGAVLTTRNPVFYDDKLIVPHDGGTTAPKQITWNGATFTVANLGGSPPAGRYAVIYKDVLWLAGANATPDRIHFAVAGSPGSTWDTVNKYLDVSYPITGLAALANAVFVFSLERTTRIRGSIPPPDSDFIKDDPIFEVGCSDNRSIANWRDKVIWASSEGLFISDGTAQDDLATICGMKSWWLDIMAGRDGFSTGTAYDPATWSIVGKVHRDAYLYCVMNGSTKVDAGVIDLKKYNWIRLKNLDFVSMWDNPYPQEVYMGRRGAARVAKASSLWLPTASNKADADGTVVEPLLETGFYGYDGIMKTLRMLFTEYDIRDAASDNPILTFSYIDSPEETSYTALTPTLAETVEITREHLGLNFPGRGIAFKVAQTNASSDTRLYGLHVHATPREGAK